MDRDAWQATVCGVTKSQTLLNDFRFTYISAALGKSRQSCPTLCDPIDGSPPGSRPWDWVKAVSSVNNCTVPPFQKSHLLDNNLEMWQ